MSILCKLRHDAKCSGYLEEYSDTQLLRSLSVFNKLSSYKTNNIKKGEQFYPTLIQTIKKIVSINWHEWSETCHSA